ncbi:TPA: hypothetical protein ACH3X1_015651 [Trebouxia sp. C0004]
MLVIYLQYSAKMSFQQGRIKADTCKMQHATGIFQQDPDSSKTSLRCPFQSLQSLSLMLTFTCEAQRNTPTTSIFQPDACSCSQQLGNCIARSHFAISRGGHWAHQDQNCRGHNEYGVMMASRHFM